MSRGKVEWLRAMHMIGHCLAVYCMDVVFGDVYSLVVKSFGMWYGRSETIIYFIVKDNHPTVS
jgi:hypothetical protein